MKKSKIRIFLCLIAVILCMTVSSFTAFAVEVDEPSSEQPIETTAPTEPEQPDVTELPQVTEQPTETKSPEEPAQIEGTEPSGNALTPEGNLTLVDDIDDDGKQFITVVTKNGNYFYIIIDHADDGENTVHFLNQVDEADLMALMEEGETPPAVCTCQEKCYAGHVDTTCEICATNMTECLGVEAQPEPEQPENPTTPDTPTQDDGGQSNFTGIAAAVLIVIFAAGTAFYVIKKRKSKPQAKNSANLDDYDYAEDDEEYTVFEEEDQEDDADADEAEGDDNA